MRFPDCVLISIYLYLGGVAIGYQNWGAFLCLTLRESICGRRYGVCWYVGICSTISCDSGATGAI